MSCTLTTSCFDLTKYFTNARSVIDSMESMKSLLAVPCFLVIYTDTTCFPYIKQIRDSYFLDHLTRYNVITFEDLHFYKYNDIIKKNREHYWPTKDERTCSESHLICCSKFQFVLQTINENPFHTKTFGWIDSNVGSNFSKICKDYNNDLLYVLQNISNKFHIQIINSVDKKFIEKENKREYYKEYRWLVCGSLFTVGKEIGLKILPRLNEIFEETTQLGYGHGEEMLYLEVLDEFYDDIERSYGDYKDTINNFIYPTKNIKYICDYIIGYYTNNKHYKEMYECCKKTLYSVEELHVFCEPQVYMILLFSHFISAYYVKNEECMSIINHITDVCQLNQNIQNEFDKKKEFYISQFRYCNEYNK